MLTRRTEEYSAQMIGLNLEIYLEIGLALEIYPDRRTEEIPAEVSDLDLEIYLGIGLETIIPNLDLEIYLGRGKGTPEAETIALVMIDTVV